MLAIEIVAVLALVFIVKRVLEANNVVDRADDELEQR